MFAVVALLALLGSLLVSVSQPAPAQAAVTGTGGQFVPMPSNARVLGGGTSAGTWRTVQVAGVAGLPSSGIGAITFMVTIADPNGSGQLQARADSGDAATLLTIYNSGVGGNTSNTGLLAVADDGSIQVKTDTAQSTVIIDVTGYYTSTQNGASAGGFTAMSPVRALDTRDGTGASSAGVLPPGSRRTLQVTGKNGIPAGAAAVAVNVIVINREAKAGWVRPTPNGADGSTGVLNYNSTKGLTTAMQAQVALGADGKFYLDTASGGGNIDLVVDIQGYFLPSNPGGGFTPLQGRLIDTRNSSSIAAGGSFTVQVGGQAGAPTVEGGLSAVAVTFTAINDSGADSYAKMWADGAAEPASSAINSDATSKVTNTVVTAVGANGKIRIKNMGSTAMNYLVDLQGAYNSLPGGPGNTNRTGQRTSATTLPFPITDQTNASVDVGTGNLLVTTTALNLPGVTQNTTIGAAYNSRATNVANTNTMDANRWQYALAGAGDLTANAQGVIYTDAVGTAWQFTPTGTQGQFKTPAGLQQTLTRVTPSGEDTQYQLKGWTSNSMTVFNLAGQPTKVTDRNGNITDFTFATSDRYKLTSLVSTAGVTGARTANSSYANGVQTFSQSSGSSSRSVSWTKNSAGDITTYTDALGKRTTFGYTSGDLTTITAPEGGVTAFTYDSSDRVTKVEQRNTTAGSPGTAVTRLSYASDTSTLVADPRSDQSKAIADTAHTSYTLDGNDLVTKAVDPEGNERSRTYNSANNGVATSTVGAAGGDVAQSKTTNKYDANNGQSLTQSESGSGSTSSATYGSSSAAAAYLPSKTTDGSKNDTDFTYDGPGNLSSTSTNGQSGSPEASTATLEYNKKGTDPYAWGAVKTAQAPGNTAKTSYSYDTNSQLLAITAPDDTVGQQKYSYDAFGRVRNHTDGNGGVTTYAYDNDDRLLTTAFDDGTPTVTNTYDGNGNLLTEQSATGTITNTYDQRNRLTSTVNTAGGGTVSYAYDLGGNTRTVTDQHGTVTHDYDSANVLTATTYPAADGGTAKQVYKIDDHGRRTDTWLGAPANATPDTAPSTWAAHQKITYGAGNKVTRVQASANSANPKQVVDLTYCYISSVATGADCSAPKSADDTDKIQWSENNLSGQTTVYTYDSNSRLTKAEQAAGGTNVTWAYTYDKAGNRLTETQSGDRTSSQTLTYNAVGQITSDGYEYDKVGNLTKAPGETFTYNGAQQLTSSSKDGVTTAYEYAGADMNKLLSQSTDGGAEYDYTYGTTDQNGVPVITSRTVAGTGTASVISDPVTGQPMDLQTTDGTTSMWVVDGIGNPTAAITDAGAKAYEVHYDPYGAERITDQNKTSTQWQQNPYGFRTGLRSSSTENGLTKFGYRWQSSVTGGWIERDTLDAPLSPTNANRYAYAGGDPINRSDSSGRAGYGTALDLVVTGEKLDSACQAGYTTESCATEAVSTVVGFATTAICEGIVGTTTTPLGAVAAAAGCAVAGELVSTAVTGGFS
ncbi:type IV secretion protein Rhs [Curtobacterium luteum]|uniref:Type IV secretion protein Rhs n=1 Tax=Curtobacterium luteum TaxID=33881 RepID=A0A8H9KZB5_9MICO|nr:type IV secretion protein Rhs [Curtobacterium luteum]